MTARTSLGEAILKHWREHCPRMVNDLTKQGRLDQAVLEAQETTGDLLFELVSVKKMDYHAAWELAMQEWALPQQEESRPSSANTKSRKSGRKRPRSRRAISA